MNQKQKDLLCAEHQFIGFSIGAMGTVHELVTSMALTAEEWLQLKKEGRVNMLTESMIEDVDRIFNIEPVTLAVLANKVVELGRANKSKYVKMLLEAFDTDSVSNLAEEHYEKFYSKLILL